MPPAEPEWGPVGAATVVRLWAERFVDILRPRPGERILDCSRDGGVLRRRLEPAVGPDGVVFEAGNWLIASGYYETYTHLLSRRLVDDRGAHLVAQVGVLAREGEGRSLALVQLAGDASPHETAVAAVLGDAARPATLTEAEVAALATGPPPMHVERLRDVLRFDGLDQLWIALVTERGIGVPLDPERRIALEASLRPWIAADGTLRIAVEAVCLAGSVGRRT